MSSTSLYLRQRVQVGLTYGRCEGQAAHWNLPVTPVELRTELAQSYVWTVLHTFEFNPFP